MGMLKLKKNYLKLMRFVISLWSSWRIKWWLKILNGILAWKFARMNLFGILWKSVKEKDFSMIISLSSENKIKCKKKQRLRQIKCNSLKCWKSIKIWNRTVKCIKFNSSLSQILVGVYYRVSRNKMPFSNT